METYKRLLLANRAWAQERLDLQSDYFERLAEGQTPQFLWIGCSDSRVPPDEVTGTGPGEVFVHRNIANLVVHTDFNLLSVLQYAVEYLEVRHIIVCGHYGCGGVTAAMGHARLGLLNKWLRHIKDIYKVHRSELDMYDDHERRRDRLVEINVLEQVQNLTKTSIIQGAWARHKRPTIHGWVFGLKDGLLKDLVKVEPGAIVDEIYTYDFDE
ncbi:MAG: carbonate dehydratase [Alphaproteobacteria bacterium]|nr:carbonate dehydratase [Alphaproteobacteria bacterium]